MNKPQSYFIFFCSITILLLIGCTQINSVKCEEKSISLTGTLTTIEDKYQIFVLNTKDKNYWIYGTEARAFEHQIQLADINSCLVILTATLSPELTNKNPECNICYKTCPTCQCPSQELLYNLQIETYACPDYFDK